MNSATQTTREMIPEPDFCYPTTSLLNIYLRKENGIFWRQIKHIQIQQIVPENIMMLRVNFIFPLNLSTILATKMEVTQFPIIERRPKIIIIIANCSPNCVQIWKGRDQKTVFCRVRHIKCRAKCETFFMSNPVKNCFLIETFLYENKILRTHNFFVETALF